MSRLISEKPRARNQRVSNTKQRRKQQLLEVNVRSSRAASLRNKRILAVTSKVLLTGLALAAIIYGVRYGSKRLFFENPDYRLTKIDVRTDGMLRAEQVRQAAELHEGENIFTINLARVRDQLLKLAQVEDAQVVRIMPGEIDIRITERKPVAWIVSGKEMGDPLGPDAAFLVDARGILMKEKQLLPEYLGLPLISGCAHETLEAGKIISSDEARAALELLQMSGRSFLQGHFQIAEIDVSKGFCMIVTGTNRSRITFGFEKLDEQLRRLELYLSWAEKEQRVVETLNLLVERNVPVTFAKLPSQIINDVYDPNDDGKILKAMPIEQSAAPKPKTSEAPIRKATPVKKTRKNQ